MSHVSLLYTIRCHWEQQCAASATALGAPVPELPCGVAMLDGLVDCALVLPGDGDGQAELFREHRCFHSRLGMQPSLAQLCWRRGCACRPRVLPTSQKWIAQRRRRSSAAQLAVLLRARSSSASSPVAVARSCTIAHRAASERIGRSTVHAVRISLPNAIAARSVCQRRVSLRSRVHKQGRNPPACACLKARVEDATMRFASSSLPMKTRSFASCTKTENILPTLCTTNARLRGIVCSILCPRLATTAQTL